MNPRRYIRAAVPFAVASSSEGTLCKNMSVSSMNWLLGRRPTNHMLVTKASGDVSLCVDWVGFTPGNEFANTWIAWVVLQWAHLYQGRAHVLVSLSGESVWL